MKSGLYITATFLFLFFSCKNQHEKDINLVYITLLSDKINSELQQVSEETAALSSQIQHNINFLADVKWENNPRYIFHKNELLYTLFSENSSAVFLPSGRRLSSGQKKIIVNSEKMDSLFITLYNRNSIVSQVYFLDSNSFLRIYPYVDVTKQFAPSTNLTEFTAFQSVKNKPFFDTKSYWIKKPYADPAGRGWIISAVSPVSFRDHFVGIVSSDIMLKTIQEKYFSSNSEMLLLVNPNGEIICSTRKASCIICIPGHKEKNYYKPVINDEFLPAGPSLLNHKEKDIRKAVNLLLNGKNKTYFYQNTHKFVIYSSKLKETGWYLLKIIN